MGIHIIVICTHGEQESYTEWSDGATYY